MSKITSTFNKTIALLWLLLFVVTSSAISQSIPEVPSRLSLGGTIVNLDKGAQQIIQEDIKSLLSNTKFWEEKLERAFLHFPIVEKILMEEEVPIDFKYLAVQESSFKPDVVSSSNAVGYWQFKSETAKELGLRVDNTIDERKNLSSATHAAAWYLKKNNAQLNNWVSTLYSYYLGVGGVKKIIPMNWSNAREITLTSKTDRYMLRFFAHKIAVESGLEKYRSASKITLIESEYGKGLTLNQISKNLNLNIQDLKQYNRWLTGDLVPSDREYLILLPTPVDNYTVTRANLSSPSPSTSQPVGRATGNFEANSSKYPILKKLSTQGNNGAELYEINGLSGILARQGDKVKTLAKDGNISTSKFLRYNDMVVEVPLTEGKVYYLARKGKKATTSFHTAIEGDTWHTVSQQYGIRLVNLLKYNRTTSKNYPIQVGQVIWLDKKRPKKQPIEIKKPTAPTQNRVEQNTTIAAQQPVVEKSEPVASYTVPANSSERKKYSPVLVEKSEEVPAKQPVVAEKSSKPSTTTYSPNDRVVIITQDDNDNSFRTNSESTTRRNESAAYSAAKEPTANYTPSPKKEVKEPTARYTPAPNRESKEPTANYTKSAPKESETRYSDAKSANSPAFHIVEAGQTYFSISRKYNLTVDELLTLNNLSDVKKLAVGQKLKVQNSSGGSSTQTTNNKANTNGTPTTHTVVSGETLFRISQNYGVSIESIQKLNNMSGNTVQLGQKLKIPAKN